MRNIETVAMILAGGQGSRLGALTRNIAKPAVPFGGKYRIIDFPLSNCAHSGIDTVGVLTQYQPLELNTYIGSGAPWDMDIATGGGVYVLPPYVKAEKGEWYKGTANAIYQNIGFVEQFDPKNVVILSGDHIYKMDYRQMIKVHEKSNADCTIAVIEVPWEETSRFGIMNTDKDNRIVEFEEKPKNAKSNLASMGVYVFKWDVLKEYLIADENDPNSSNDFGKNVIPAMLNSGRRRFAYAFSGYWKDVGTVQSLWEANMDLISTDPVFNLHDPHWRILSRNAAMPPHYIGMQAKLTDSCITEGCEVYGTVKSSVLFNGVHIGEGAVVTDSILFPGVSVGRGAVINKAILGMNVSVGSDAVIGDPNSSEQKYLSTMCTDGITLIADDKIIGSGVHVAVGSMVEEDIKE